MRPAQRLQSSSPRSSGGMARRTSSALVWPRATLSKAARRRSRSPALGGLLAEFPGRPSLGDQPAELAVDPRAPRRRRCGRRSRSGGTRGIRGRRRDTGPRRARARRGPRRRSGASRRARRRTLHSGQSVRTSRWAITPWSELERKCGWTPRLSMLCTAPGRRGRVQRGQHEVAAVGGADGRLGRDRVADLADHDHVGRLAEHAPQQLGEADVRLGVDLRLPQPRDGVLDRVLDRVDLPLAVVQVPQAGVERRRLARAGRAAHEDQAAGDVEHRGQLVELPAAIMPSWSSAITCDVQTEQADRHVLAVQGRDRADAQVDPPRGRCRHRRGPSGRRAAGAARPGPCRPSP